MDTETWDKKWRDKVPVICPKGHDVGEADVAFVERYDEAVGVMCPACDEHFDWTPPRG
jgi:hypothetical protein